MSEVNNQSRETVDYILKNDLESLSLTKLLGLTCSLIYDKKLFSSNRDIKEFIEKVYNRYFLDYVFESRTLIVARITREIYQMDDEESDAIRKNLKEYFKIEINKDNSKKDKKDANEKLKTWLEGL